MSVVTGPASPFLGARAILPTDLVWQLSVDQYHEMVRTGILTEDDPVELLEGLLVPKMPKNPRHRAATRLLCKALERLAAAGWYVDTQEPITTADSEPEPDVAVVRGDTLNYLDRHPSPADLALVAEVADATLSRDRGPKKRLYARAAVPVYWIVNLINNQVEVYTEPSGAADSPDYRQQHNYGILDQVPVVIEGREIGRLSVRDLLP